MVIDILMMIHTALHLVIGLAITRTALKRPGMHNLYWLSLVFYSTGASGFLTPQSFWRVLLPMLVPIPLVFFIHQTFYRDRPSPYLVFLFAAFGWVFFSLITVPPTNLLSSYSSLTTAPILVWLWHGVSAHQAYKALAHDRFVEDWVKARYRMMVVYSISMVIPLIVMAFLSPTAPLVVQFVGRAVIPFFMIISIILQFLVWVIPEPFRRWLNRNYQSPVRDAADLELSEEEIMQRLTVPTTH